MKAFYKLSLILILAPLISLAGPVKGKYTKTKKLAKNFNLSSTGTVAVDNSFGSIIITTWDKNQVSLEVTVEVSGNDEDDVDERLKEIDVNFSSNDTRVAAVTKSDGYRKKSTSFWSLLTGGSSNDNENIKIDYIIKMPVTGSVDISNDYGAVILDRLEGVADISCDFGRLDIGQLLHTGNTLKFDYTNNSTIDYMKGGTIKADFSDYTLYGADKLTFNGDYTKAKLHKVNSIAFNSDFSTITADQSERIDGRGDYSTIRIGQVSQSVVLNTDFGTIKIEELGPQFTDVTIKSDYTGINIGYHKDAAFTFAIDADFASINVSSDLTITRSENDGSEKSKSGYAIDAASTSTIQIKTEFGGATLKKN